MPQKVNLNQTENLARPTFPSEGTGAGVSGEGGEVAASPVPAGAGVTDILHGHLAQRRGEPHRAGALQH